MLGVVDLFSGCGGLSFGFQMAGYRVLLGLDLDQASLATFRHNHPGASVMCRDIRTVSVEDINAAVSGEDVDVLVGGPPCQGFSLSGPRRVDDPRNSLYLSYLKIIRGLMPRAFVLENVPGLVSLYGGSVKESLIENFEAIGYTVEYRVLNAADYGVPQHRRRVVFVGLLDGQHFEFPEPSHTSSTWLTSSDAVSDLPDASIGDSMLTQRYDRPPQNAYQSWCRLGSDGVRNHQITNHSRKTQEIISLVPEGGNYKDLPEHLRDTRRFHVAWTRLDSTKPAPTVDTGHRHHFHYVHNRVPTVRENARFQSFPDTFVFFGNKSDQYRQVGNAVPPLLARSLAIQLAHQLT